MGPRVPRLQGKPRRPDHHRCRGDGDSQHAGPLHQLLPTPHVPNQAPLIRAAQSSSVDIRYRLSIAISTTMQQRGPGAPHMAIGIRAMQERNILWARAVL
jgi:hypothetical protein